MRLLKLFGWSTSSGTVLLTLLGVWPHIVVSPQQKISRTNPIRDIFSISNGGLLPIFDGNVNTKVYDLANGYPGAHDANCASTNPDYGTLFEGIGQVATTFREIEPGDAESFSIWKVIAVDDSVPDSEVHADIGISVAYYVFPHHIWQRHTTRHFVTVHGPDGTAYWFQCSNGNMLAF